MQACDVLSKVTSLYEQNQLNGAIDILKQFISTSDKNDSKLILFKELLTFISSCKDNDNTTQLYKEKSAVAFNEFINGWGNVELYDSVAKFLSSSYQTILQQATTNNVTILDIGVGSGKALIGACNELLMAKDTPNNNNNNYNVNSLNFYLLEPSAEFLKQTELQLQTLINNRPKNANNDSNNSTFLSNLTIMHESVEAKIQDVLDKPNLTFNIKLNSTNKQWNIAQSSFALQNLNSNERINLFKKMIKYSDSLIIIEFDIPIFNNENEKFTYVIDKYSSAINTYKHHQQTTTTTTTATTTTATTSNDNTTNDLVIQYFLMPIMLKFLNETEYDNSHNEMPINTWKSELIKAGYKHDCVNTVKLFDFWWGTSYAIIAKSHN